MAALKQKLFFNIRLYMTLERHLKVIGHKEILILRYVHIPLFLQWDAFQKFGMIDLVLI